MKNHLLVFFALCMLGSGQLFAQQTRPKATPTNTNTNTNTNTPTNGSPKTNTNTNTGRPKATVNTGNTTTPKGNTAPTNTPQQSNIHLPGMPKKVFIGGGVNATTNGTTFAIEANPYLGYRLMRNAQIGIGPTLQYRPSSSTPIIWGGRAFARYDVIPNVFVEGQYEFLNYQNADNQNRSTHRLPIGGGYNRNFMGVNTNVSITYDLLYKKGNSPYNSPLTITGGINFGR